jgi:uncharacterized phiE125 gp8 family phage protein
VGLELVTAPAVEPLTVSEAKTRLGLGSEVSDALISSLISVARQTIDGRDGWLGRALIRQTWKYTIDNFSNYSEKIAPRTFEIPLSPLISIDSIGYRDVNGTLQVIAPEQYRLITGSPARLIAFFNVFWPSYYYRFGSFEIQFTAGYGTQGTDVPEPIRQAMCLMINQLKTLSTRDQNVMISNIYGVGSTTYAVGRDSGADALTVAAQALLSPYRLRV